MRKIFLVIASTLLTKVILASEGAHHAGTVEIPFHEIGPQIFNFLVFFGLLIFFLRKPTIAMFANRASNYEQTLNKANQALIEAKARKGELEAKITELRAGHKKSIEQARLEAQAIKDTTISDAKIEVKRMLEEADKTIRVEVDKAKAELRNFMLHQAVTMADKDLGGQLDVNEQKRLQKEFAGKIQVLS